nr:hypothetical protein [Tanacetum cinerariifolium]
MDACAALTRRVEHLEFDKVAQALEIIKLKRRVKKLEKKNKVRVLKLRRLQKNDAIVLKDDKEKDREVADANKDVEEAKVDKSAQDQRRQAESQAKIYKIVMDHANKVLSMKEDETKLAEVQEVVEVVTTANLIYEVTVASDPNSAASTTIPAVAAQVLAATLTVAPARVAVAPSRRRKGVVIRDPESESTTSTIIPAKTKSKDKGKWILDEVIDLVKIKAKEDPAVKKYQALKRKPQTEKATPLARKVPVVDYHIIKMNNKPYYKIIRADDTNQLYKNQRTIHGLAKVKGWKLLESCGVQIITFTSTQLILLVERKYPLIRFTLDQMLNAVRLKVEEESEVSLELLRFIRQQHQEGQLE